MSSSIKKNILLNGINTITSIIFPIITFPYAARILLPDGIGIINFFNSIIGYITLLTSLGIPLYAVKEVAKYRDKKEERDKITIEILCLSFILCIFGYIAVWLLVKYIPQIHQDAPLFYILSLSIIFTAIGVNWFYQAIEDFKFITIRAIIIRTLAAIALFIFVKNSSDLLIYGLIIVGSTVGNNILNFTHLRKHINISKTAFINLKISRHIRPAIEIFVMNLIISLYIQLNSIMLGFISGDAAVGYFTAGTKIPQIALMLIGSIGTVLLPRCSNLLQTGKKDEFKTIITKSINLTNLLAFPLCIGLIVLSSPLILLLCGPDFADSISVQILNAPVIIFIGLTNVLGIQILYPMDKTKIVIWSVSIGAIVNLILNLILIPRFSAIGAAIATLVAELSVLIVQLTIGRKYYPFCLKKIINIKYIFSAFIMGVLVWISTKYINNFILEVIVGFIIGVTAYFAILLALKDSIAIDLYSSLKNKITYHEKI